MAVEKVRIEGLEGVLKTLQELPPEVVSKHGGPVRSALRKASLILVEEAKANVGRIIAEPNKDGRPTKSLGLLQENIITLRDSRMQNGERYTVRVRKKRVYPDSRGDKVPVGRVGILLERGTEKRAPMPWMRPAFDARKHEVLGIFTQQINASLRRITRRLARKNGVKL